MTRHPSTDRWPQPVVRLFSSLSPMTCGLFIAITFAALQPLLSHYSRFFWYLPAGARFAALLLLPRRYWLWLIAGEWFARGMAALQYDATILRSVMATFPQPLAGLIAVWLLRRKNARIRPDTPIAMACLVGAFVFSACIEAASMIVFVRTDPPAPLRMGVPNFALSVFLGDLSGVLLLAPAALALSQAGPLFSRWRPLLTDALLGLGVPLFALYLVQRSGADPLVCEYARIFTAVPVIYFAFRYGWRGAALATTVAGFTLAPLHISLGAAPDLSLGPQLPFIITSIAALLLGAALDSQRASGAVLTTQNLDLELANRDLDRLSTELRDAAQRNLRMEETQRRRLAAEIHDELGQNLTAVHTRIRLATDRLDAAHLGDVSSSIIDILGTMRRSVHGLMDTLRPPALDEFGLLRALADGPLRDMVEQADMRYHFASAGEPSLVDALCEDTQIAIWRIVQESVTNSVRHARARRFDARLRIGIRGEVVWTILDLRDDGIGVDASRVHGDRSEGLQGLRDRVLALDGAMRLTSSAGGTRLHVLLRQAI